MWCCASRRTNPTVCRRGRAVLEMEYKAAAFFVLNKLQAFIEICAFGRHSTDELVEGMRAMYALHAILCLYVTGLSTFAFILGLALRSYQYFFDNTQKIFPGTPQQSTYDNVRHQIIGVTFPYVRGLAYFLRVIHARGLMSLRARWMLGPTAIPALFLSTKECAAP